jgi:hypothetical protein
LIRAIFGPSGQVDATHAAMILTDVHAALDDPVPLIQFPLAGEASLPPRRVTPDPVQLIERPAGTAGKATRPAMAELTKTFKAGRQVVLDLPRVWLADPALRRHLDVAVLAAGPAPLDKHAACRATATVDVRMGGMRVPCITKAYPNESPAFDPGLVAEV